MLPYGGVLYERRFWHDAGGAGDQDAWLAAATDYVCQVQNRVLMEASTRRNREKGQADA